MAEQPNKKRRIGDESVAATSLKDTLDTLMENYPTIVDCRTEFASITSESLCSYVTMFSAPAIIPHYIPPQWFEIKQVGTKTHFIFFKRLLPPDLTNDLIHRLHARAKDMCGIIQCDDGKVYRPNYRMIDGQFRSSMATQKVKCHNIGNLLQVISNIMMNVEKITMNCFNSIVQRLAAVQKGGAEIIDECLIAISDLASDSGQSVLQELSTFKKLKRDLVTAVLPLYYGQRDLVSIIDELEGLDKTIIRKIISEHPAFAQPLVGSRKVYFNERGNVVQPVLLETIPDDTLVFCATRFIQVSSVQAVTDDTRAYPCVLFKSTTEGGQTIRGAKMIGVMRPASLFKRIAILNRNIARIEEEQQIANTDDVTYQAWDPEAIVTLSNGSVADVAVSSNTM